MRTHRNPSHVTADVETPETLELVEHHTPAFAMVPEWAIFSRKLTNHQYRVYTILCLYANKYDRAWPKVENLAEKAGISHQAISKTIRELAALGLVTITKTGFPARNRYLVYRGSQPPKSWSEGGKNEAEDGEDGQEDGQLQPQVDSADTPPSCNPTLHQLQPVVARVATSEVADEQTNRTDHKNSVSQENLLGTSLATAVAPPERRTRERLDLSALKRDPLIIALAACFGREPATPREWEQWRLAVNDLHTAGATADDIPRAIRGYQTAFPDSRIITPFALVKHWSEIQGGTPHAIRQHEITRRTLDAEKRERDALKRAEQERRAREAAEVERYMREHGLGARA